MNILVLFKVVYDDQDIIVKPDGELDFSRAHQVISMYDLNAIEAAALLKEQVEGSTLRALSVGAKAIDDSKLKKSVLARGVDELLMVADDALEGYDTNQTAHALSKLVAKAGDWDLIVCGDGSSDVYAQQVDVQLAALLGVPMVNAATAMAVDGGALIVDRLLEEVTEKVKVSLPAVVSVMPDIALPRICGMKDILAAGKKPAEVLLAEGASIQEEATVLTLQAKATEQVDRACEVYDASNADELDKFVSAALETLR